MSSIQELKTLLLAGDSLPPDEWQLRAVQSEQCASYVAWNQKSHEALLIDPKDEELEAYRTLATQLKGYLWLAIIDTHTHADHVSIAPLLAAELGAPMVMHRLSQSSRVDMRVGRSTLLPSHAGPIRLLETPGHTADSITVIWGPFIFSGDLLLFGDSGRDDLPGGDPEAHYESIQKLKALAQPEMILLPGHDHEGGRASSWASQLRLNSSLTQNRDDFIREAAAFDAPAPKFLKKSLRENTR